MSPATQPTLFVNDGPLPPPSISPLHPTPSNTPIPEIRRLLSQNGYVFMKGILPRPAILRAREAYFDFLSPSGILKPGTRAVDGIFDAEGRDAGDYPGIGAGDVEALERYKEGLLKGKGGEDRRDEKDGHEWEHPQNVGGGGGVAADAADTANTVQSSRSAQFIDLALRAHTEPFYRDELCKLPELVDFVSKVTGWGADTMALQRTLLRNNTPGNQAIGVHYDQIFLRHGEDTNLTIWLPLGDVKREGGGLIYLEDGHLLGEEIERDFMKKAKESGLTDEEMRDAFNRNMMTGGLLSHNPAAFAEEHGKRWLVADYEAGDFVLHSSYAIHASTINHDPEGRIRLGTDLRFVNSKRPWDTRWNDDYRLDDGI